ncbi:MAG: suppressor of fused domain protein, partial [Candidatus Eremiobacterota bacterium]
RLLADRARSAASLGRFEASLADYRKALDLDMEDGEIWLGYGSALRHAGRPEESRQALERAIRLEPDLELRLRRMGSEVAASVLPDAQSTGRGALDRAVTRAYPLRPPDQLLLADEVDLGGLDSVRAWLHGDHWHVVAYGLSDLDCKAGGMGVEITLRAAAPPGGQLPAWSVELLQTLASALRHQSRPPRAGEMLHMNGPLVAGLETSLRSVVLTPDPALGEPVVTPYGSVTFMLAVGVTEAEAQAIGDWGADTLLDQLRRKNPSLVTDPSRACSMADSGFQSQVRTSAERSGAAQGQVAVTNLAWERRGEDEVVLTFSSTSADSLKKAIGDRLRKGQDLRLTGSAAGRAEGLQLSPTRSRAILLRRIEDDDLEIEEAEGTLVLGLPHAMVEQLYRELRPAPGEYWFPPGLVLRLD